jgi:type IV pilus assembly protein PilW
MNNSRLRSRPARYRERGFSVIELVVAMAISVFLLAGLFTILQGTHKTSDNERLLAQLQDDERIAMTLLGNVIESAGYYSNALTTDVSTALPVSANFATAGQAVFGATNAQGDTITLRYQANQADGVLNCQGANAPTGRYENEFSVDNKGQLVCAINGLPPVPLVGGNIPLVGGGTSLSIRSLTIRYGVGSAITAPNSAGTVDAYLTAAQMTAVNWTNVYTVRVTITFANPMFGQPGQAGRPTITFTRVISLKSRTGVNVAAYI